MIIVFLIFGEEETIPFITKQGVQDPCAQINTPKVQKQTKEHYFRVKLPKKQYMFKKKVN